MLRHTTQFLAVLCNTFLSSLCHLLFHLVMPWHVFISWCILLWYAILNVTLFPVLVSFFFTPSIFFFLVFNFLCLTFAYFFSALQIIPFFFLSSLQSFGSVPQRKAAFLFSLTLSQQVLNKLLASFLKPRLSHMM